MCDFDSLSPAAADELLSVLAHDDCRAVLRYFDEHPADVATVDDLAAFACERRETEDRTRVEMSLHHSALPKLADAGLLDYDARSNTARCRDITLVEEWLTPVAERGEVLG